MSGSSLGKSHDEQIAAKVCPKCAGTGLDGRRDQWGFGMPCPRCNGTGKR